MSTKQEKKKDNSHFKPKKVQYEERYLWYCPTCNTENNEGVAYEGAVSQCYKCGRRVIFTDDFTDE